MALNRRPQVQSDLADVIKTSFFSFFLGPIRPRASRQGGGGQKGPPGRGLRHKNNALKLAFDSVFTKTGAFYNVTIVQSIYLIYDTGKLITLLVQRNPLNTPIPAPAPKHQTLGYLKLFPPSFRFFITLFAFTLFYSPDLQ